MTIIRVCAFFLSFLGLALAMASQVAIIGGGISGLACAQRLQSAGISAVVFDTGKRAVGGRCSSRIFTAKDGTTYVFDHSAQFLTANSPAFDHEVQKLQGQGLVREWNGRVGTLTAGGFVESTSENKMYVGTLGMKSFSEGLSRGLTIERPSWVSKMEKRVGSSGSIKWDLYEHKKFLGNFDAVVIAHNGKCADRLISTAGVPKVHNILRVNFGPSLPPSQKKSRKMQLCSLWVGVFGVLTPVGLDFEGSHVNGSGVLSWVCNNSKKLKQPTGEGKIECWTLISTREFGAANKVRTPATG